MSSKSNIYRFIPIEKIERGYVIPIFYCPEIISIMDGNVFIMKNQASDWTSVTIVSYIGIDY